MCRLPSCLSKHRLSVAPVVARIDADFKPIPNPDEVEAVFAMPLRLFVFPEDGMHYSRDVAWGDDGGSEDEGRGLFTYRLHFFKYGGFTVWGLTALILIQVRTADSCKYQLFIPI